MDSGKEGLPLNLSPSEDAPQPGSMLPETEEAMTRLVWDSTGVGGPELFQQELCCIIQYSPPWSESMFTDAVIDKLKKSAAVKEWQEFYERGEIPNRVIYR
jgi:hypothetical protein